MKNKLINIILFFASCLLSLCLSELTLNFLGVTSFYAETYNPNSYIVRTNNEFNYGFRTNSDGLREKEINLEKKEDELRILFLGDSFTEGVGVKTEERFSNLLENNLNLKNKSLTTINAAITATGPTEYARILTHIGLKYEPDYIVIGIFANDIHNVDSSFSIDAIKNKYSKKFNIDSSLKSKLKIYFARTYRLYKQILPDLLNKTNFETKLVSEIKLKNISDSKFQEWKNRISKKDISDIENRKVNEIVFTTGLLRPDYFVQALDLVDKENNLQTILKTLDYIKSITPNSKLIILYLPCPLQISEIYHNPENPWIKTGTIVEKKWLEEESNFEKNLNKYSSEQNITYINLTDNLRKANKDGVTTNFLIDSHMNVNGHKIVADVIKQYLCLSLECE